MLIKLALMMFVAAFLGGAFLRPKDRTWVAKLALAGFCLFLMAALIRLLKF